MFKNAKTKDLEDLLSDLYDTNVPPNTLLIRQVEAELIERDLDRKAGEDLEEMLDY